MCYGRDILKMYIDVKILPETVLFSSCIMQEELFLCTSSGQYDGLKMVTSYMGRRFLFVFSITLNAAYVI